MTNSPNMLTLFNYLPGKPIVPLSLTPHFSEVCAERAKPLNRFNGFSELATRFTPAAGKLLKQFPPSSRALTPH